MASPLQFKVYDPKGDYIAATRDAEIAAAVVALIGDGGKVRLDGWVVWREGKEAQSAGESYDYAAGAMYDTYADKQSGNAQRRERMRLRQQRLGIVGAT